LNCISLDLEHSYQLSETSILEATRAAIPQTKYTGKIWWNVACDLAIKKKKYALHRMKRARVPLDVIIFKRCRAKARRVILEVKQSSWENFCNALTSNSKLSTVWNVIKKFSGHHPREFIPSLRQGSTTACNNQHKANMLATHFQSVSSTSNYEIAFRRTMSSLEVETLEAASEITLKDPQLNQLFSIDELQCALPTTKNSAPGADQICYKLPKHLPNDSLRVLVHFINSVWATGALPTSWCHSIVVPIHKPTKPAHLPSSHRPISLTSAVCKLMEKMIVSRLKWCLEYCKILGMPQSGLKNRRRTTDHILRLHDTVQKSLANRHHVLAIIIDLEEACDMVLLFKLVQMGINGIMFNFINSFLSRRTCQVRLGSPLSSTKTLENGIPHGSVLSPILFTIAINDLP